VLESLHPSLQEYLANVAILVEEIPSDEILSQYDPPVSPGELLGYFSGASLMDRSVEDPWSHLPSAIILFRRCLQRYAQSHEQLIEELSTTIYHEVGHFLGLDEEDLKERGLE
jgi:predicted Zn-dependent protease with MMP-like domain